MSGEKIANPPKGERGWVRYYNVAGNESFLLTSKESNRDFYYLYKIADGVLKKVGRAKSPLELVEKHGILKPRWREADGDLGD